MIAEDQYFPTLLVFFYHNITIEEKYQMPNSYWMLSGQKMECVASPHGDSFHGDSISG